MTISPWRTGFAVGGLLGLFHLAWAIAVAFGAAQPIVDFILRIHFIEPAVPIAPFDPGFATTLVLVTAATGFVLGYAFAAIWNLSHRESAARGGRQAAAN